MPKIYYYKEKPYKIVAMSQIKTSGILENLIIDDIIKLRPQGEWIPVVIYECLDPNLEGKVWVREQNQFFKLFKTEPNANISKDNS